MATAPAVQASNNGCTTTTSPNNQTEQQTSVTAQNKSKTTTKAKAPVKPQEKAPVNASDLNKSSFSFKDITGSEESEDDSDTFHGTDPLMNAVKVIVATLLSTII
ncbi:hypothetical protein [Pontibacter vulgaris]|uniref:hypothetical protein n=1 Tax=Pontibacter vulgaris TaxID=2905679 RepID=UPI001FA80001|nr:hypothetical protein [Pontibacter vulgaris]